MNDTITLGLLKPKVCVKVSLTSETEPPKTLRVFSRSYDQALDHLNTLVGWEFNVIDVEVL